MARSQSPPDKLRISLEIKAISMIETSPEKLEEFNEGKRRTVVQTEDAIEGLIASGDYSRDNIGDMLAIPQGYDKYYDTEVEANMEGYCVKHDEWFPMHYPKTANCWRCKGENLRDPKDPDGQAE